MFIKRIFSRLWGKNHWKGTRNYKVAVSDRLTSSWQIGIEKINDAIKAGLIRVRGLARELFKNNDYVKGYIGRSIAGIVGPNGFTFQNNAKLSTGEYDEISNNIIENAWEEWCKAEYCTMQKNISFLRVLWLWIIQKKRDGEILFRVIENPRVNKFGFSLELLEPDILDHNYNEELPNGNRVIMGVELNSWKQPVNYYFKTESQVSNRLNLKIREKVSADEIIHLFEFTHSDQVRGISDLVQSMLPLHNLDLFESSSLTNAIASARKMGFIVTEKNSLGSDYEGDDMDENGNVISEFEEGSIEELPKGKTFVGWEPKYPTEQHPSFVKSILRRISTGLRTAYNPLANDYESVNFSSLRAGKTDETDNYLMEQNLIKEGILNRLFPRWLRMAMITGAVPIDYIHFERVCKPNFQGRGFPYVDPAKEVKADLDAITNNIDTYTNVCRKRGYSFVDLIETRAREELTIKKAEEKYKVSLMHTDKKQNENVITDDNDNGE